MKLEQLKSSGGTSIDDICAELSVHIQRVFKWFTQCVPSPYGGEVVFVYMSIPNDISLDMFEFTLKMIRKTLPNLIYSSLGKDWTMMEPRIKGLNLQSVAIDQESLPRMLNTFNHLKLLITIQKLD